MFRGQRCGTTPIWVVRLQRVNYAALWGGSSGLGCEIPLPVGTEMYL